LLKTYNDVLRFLTQAQLLAEAKARKLSRLVASTAQREQVCNEVLEKVRALREHLATVTYALVDGLAIPESSLAALEVSLKVAAVHRRLVRADTRFTWQWIGVAGDLASPLWLLGDAAGDLLLSQRVSHIRSCADESCRWLFLDNSKNHSRRWCNMKICGNRMKARRFHSRTTETAK
jgi:predicted RNA-binding Zn ribbon-like protein